MTGVIVNNILIHKISELNRDNVYRNHLLLMKVYFLCFSVTTIAVIINSSYEHFLYLSILLWLGSIAYTDKICGYVYCVMEYYAILPAVASVIWLYYSCSDHFRVTEGIIINLIYVIVLKIFSRLNMFGEGDADILSIISFPVMSFVISSTDYYIFDILILNILLFTIASFIFLVRNIKYISVRTMKLKEPRPFIPSIFNACVIYYFTFLIK